MTRDSVTIVGAGLAGSECAWQLARRGHPVRLFEMRPKVKTAAHQTGLCAELVCSNSFRSDNPRNAVGLLKREMELLDSLVIASARAAAVPAGDALAMDRDEFSRRVTEAIESRPEIEIVRDEVTEIPRDTYAVLATGPLTSEALDRAIGELLGTEDLYFYDSMAPIVAASSLDLSKMYPLSRYGKGSGDDYLNCPLTKEEYERFVADLLSAEIVPVKDFEKGIYFEGCLPIEVMAERGAETLRHGPMKPFGLTNPRDPQTKAYAIVQLRQDNKLGTLYNMVGFQTKLKHGEQTRIFRTIPGLERAEFARLGGLHRNTFLNAPKLLDGTLRLNAMPRLRFAGQITGCEGYVESAAVGLLAGRFAAAERRGEPVALPPHTTAHGALLAYITGDHIGAVDAGPRSYQPMNVNFGLFPPLAQIPSKNPDGTRLRGTEKTIAKRRAICARALADLDQWIGGARIAAE